MGRQTFSSIQVEVASLDGCHGWVDDVVRLGVLRLAGLCT